MNPEEFIRNYEGESDSVFFEQARNYITTSEFGKDLKNLLQRMDYDVKKEKRGRSLESFLSDIKTRTDGEHKAVEVFKGDLIRRSKMCTYSHNGVEPSGNLVTKKQHVGKSDYVLNIDGHIIEADMKKSPVNNKATFKVDELRRALRNNAYILLFIGAGFKNEKLNQSRWALFGSETIKRLLELPQFNFAPFGNKKVVMVKEENFTQFFTLYKVGGTEDVRFEFDQYEISGENG